MIVRAYFLLMLRCEFVTFFLPPLGVCHDQFTFPNLLLSDPLKSVVLTSHRSYILRQVLRAEVVPVGTCPQDLTLAEGFTTVFELLLLCDSSSSLAVVHILVGKKLNNFFILLLHFILNLTDKNLILINATRRSGPEICQILMFK